MDHVQRLLDNNRALADRITREDPGFFARLAEKQEPYFLFIGCSDSRVPLETLTGVKPGEMFVHRNIANQVLPADLNCLAVLQYAVEALDVKDLIVCGHYGCGGVRAAMDDEPHGLVDHWLAGIRDTVRRNAVELTALADPEARLKRVVELNVLRQVYHLARTPIVLEAWKRGPRPVIHGVVYDIGDGRLRELVRGVDSLDKVRTLIGL